MRKSTKTTIGIATAAIVLGGGAGAYAFWTGLGFGSADALVATTASTVKVVLTSAITDMGPGVNPVTLKGTFTNTGNSAARVPQLKAEVDTITGGSGVAPLCTKDDYIITDAPLTLNIDLPVGTGTTAWEGMKIGFLNSTTRDQSACIGTTVKLKFTFVTPTPTPTPTP